MKEAFQIAGVAYSNYSETPRKNMTGIHFYIYKYVYIKRTLFLGPSHDTSDLVLFFMICFQRSKR